METIEYYNAKPSKISNIGKDIAGAKRMNFDTYETTEEREIKERKKVTDKRIAAVKLALKTEVLSDSASIPKIIELLTNIFELTHGVAPVCKTVRDFIEDMRLEGKASGKPVSANINKLVNAYNRHDREVRRLGYYPTRYLAKMRAKYAPKGSFTEESGQSFDWKNFDKVDDLKGTLLYLQENASAVQFGNSVSDNERAFISSSLAEFLNQFKTHFPKISLQPVNWSFGARGKAGSVAYYQASGKIISVNRNNIGSLIHELGHYIDHISGTISKEMSFKTVQSYVDTLPKEMSSKQRRYYGSRCEIFARAFEAYCFKRLFGFSNFAQCGKAYLPELNEELINLIEKAFN